MINEPLTECERGWLAYARRLESKGVELKGADLQRYVALCVKEEAERRQAQAREGAGNWLPSRPLPGACSRCGRHTNRCKCPDPFWKAKPTPQRQTFERPMHLQDELEEAAKAHVPVAGHGDRSHAPTIEEQERFWSEPAPAPDPLAPTVSELIDRLCIVHCKMFALIDRIEQGEDDRQVAEAARKVARLNRERSALKNGIERCLSGADAKQEVKV